jgi:hypothetical protein
MSVTDHVIIMPTRLTSAYFRKSFSCSEKKTHSDNRGSRGPKRIWREHNTLFYQVIIIKSLINSTMNTPGLRGLVPGLVHFGNNWRAPSWHWDLDQQISNPAKVGPRPVRLPKGCQSGSPGMTSDDLSLSPLETKRQARQLARSSGFLVVSIGLLAQSVPQLSSTTNIFLAPRNNPYFTFKATPIIPK